jgi:hypothetical protein
MMNQRQNVFYCSEHSILTSAIRLLKPPGQPIIGVPRSHVIYNWFFCPWGHFKMTNRDAFLHIVQPVYFRRKNVHKLTVFGFYNFYWKTMIILNAMGLLLYPCILGLIFNHSFSPQTCYPIKYKISIDWPPLMQSIWGKSRQFSKEVSI